jgi:predicted transposase YdaD
VLIDASDCASSYREGYANGHAHGELHGTFEGRELGQLKGFEVWEEVGYYEGMARFWLSNLEAQAPDTASR